MAANPHAGPPPERSTQAFHRNGVGTGHDFGTIGNRAGGVAGTMASGGVYHLLIPDGCCWLLVIGCCLLVVVVVVVVVVLLLLVFASGSKTVPTKYLFSGFIMFIVVFRPGGHVHPHCLGTYLTHARTLKAFVFKVLRNALNVATYFTHARTLKAFLFKVLRNGLPRYILYTCPNLM